MSDYWGQERIGADLLKEELQKVPPIQKHLVAVFDNPQDIHDIKVKNLISNKGKHSVLPEMTYTSVHDVSGVAYRKEPTVKDGVIVINEILTAVNYLEESDALLNKVQNICGEEK